MRLRQESFEAYERINSFVSLERLSLSLQMKMLWLGSKLSYESGLYGETRTWVDRLTAVLADVLEDVEDPEFVNQVESDALLTLAESLLKSDQIEEGLAILARVRNEFGGSESAERSYLVEARHLADQDLVVESSQLLNVLVTENPQSKFAPLALYEIALNAEKRGQGEYLNQALELLDRIARDYPESDLVYYARLKQGNLARRLNKFETAEVVYESLENTYRDRPDRYWAQISLADTLIARASEDPSKFEAGISRLELLMDLPNVPIELRVEAGYKIGTAWETQGEKLKAKAAYWDLYDLFVLKEEGIQSLGKKGRYWLSRSMFELAEIFENESNLDTAVEFYEKIELLGLVGSELARARIEQLRGRSPVASVQ
jgi:TolA-binding protein